MPTPHQLAPVAENVGVDGLILMETLSHIIHFVEQQESFAVL